MMGDGRWEMGDGRWEMGDGRWEICKRGGAWKGFVECPCTELLISRYLATKSSYEFVVCPDFVIHFRSTEGLVEGIKIRISYIKY